MDLPLEVSVDSNHPETAVPTMHASVGHVPWQVPGDIGFLLDLHLLVVRLCPQALSLLHLW